MTRSTSLARPVNHVEMPLAGLVAMSVTRKEEERLMQYLRIFWSIFSEPEEEPEMLEEEEVEADEDA